MTTVRWAALTIALTTVACSTILVVFRGASLMVTAPSGEARIMWKNQSVVLLNGLDDPNGLAGLEVEIGGHGIDRRVLTAKDLPSARFGVPESGTIQVAVGLRRDGRVVAEGRATWDLEADVEWWAEVRRAPYPLGAVADNITGPNPISCNWFWCHSVWRFEIDMDSYRVEKRAIREIMLEDEDAEIDPVPGVGGAGKGDVEIDRLSAIIGQFNDLFGGIDWQDADRVSQMITETIPAKVAQDTAFKNARENSDRENARIEHDRALARVMTSIMKDDTELFKQFVDNTDFKRWLGDTVFRLAYAQAGSAPEPETL